MIPYYWTSQIKSSKTVIKQILQIYWTLEKIHNIKYRADNLKIMISNYKWTAIKVLHIKMGKKMVWMSSAKTIKLGAKPEIFLIMWWSIW